MKQIIKDILTTVDGDAYAVAKVLGVMVVLLFMVLQIASFCTGKPFNGESYGIGAGAAIVAMGAAIKLSETSEPKK